ncbi:DUF1428 domain-containing protein [Vibrio tubiashii]|uniref:DUF1428 domain-containing protein n=1 Tax=Vibrio tubiashii TaxID=29498 RepID=UPI001EFCFC37|nr:DUF1428 domain-containing protein [Vibrio tubiashii]MCG9576447.1 DUF1428 domain-containing protein [Vibrio tubiashii]
MTTYVDGFVAAVPIENKQKYLEHVKRVSKVFKEYGAVEYVECWGDDLPKGQKTSMSLAVQAKSDETVVFSWVVWQSKAQRVENMPKLMQDPRVKREFELMPFDSSRLIYGGFETLVRM